MPDTPIRGVDVPPSSFPLSSPQAPIADAPAGGASRGGGLPDDGARARRLRALATEIESLPTTHAAFARLLTVAVETLHGAGAWVGLTMEDSDSLVAVATAGEIPVESGARVPRERAFAARALSGHSAVFADPSTGVRWSDTVIARTPVRAVAAPLLVDGEHAVGVISIIGGPGRLFTVADGTFVHELGALATLVLRRRDTATRVVAEPPAAAPEVSVTTPMLFDAAAAVTVDDFALATIQRLEDAAFLGVSIAIRDRSNGTLRFPAALGALATLRGVRTPLDSARAEQLGRQRRAVHLPDARQLVPEGWRSLVPALPGASIALVDGDIAIGRVDLVFDPERAVPPDAMRRIEQQAGALAKAFSLLMTRVARTPTDPGLETLHAMRVTLASRLHDLTSPIAGISALAELLAEEPLTPEVLELVTLIQRSARRAADVARTLRGLADDADESPEPVVIEPIITELLRERAESQRALSITVNVTIDPALPPVPWTATALRDWFATAIVASETALLASARRRIDVRAALDGALAVLTVADDGVPVGIVPSEAELHGASVSVIRTDDGRTIRRLAIPLRIGSSLHLQ
ncbi:MAG: HAMP domain-containing histidine kinase [Gemmatimonadaceae bacterium]|nr:HAMP domain-containing histidine kinase [Gemmatimonadaceae bacterium]